MTTSRKSAPTNRLVVGILVLFIVFALTIDLYWLVHVADLPARDDIIARLYRFYAPADRDVFDKVGQGELASSALGVLLMPALNVLLLAALLRRRPLRVPLQIAIGSCAAYSVFFRWWHGLLGGFPGMNDKTLEHFGLYFGANLPWLVGSLYILWDGMHAARQALQPPATGRRRAGNLVPGFQKAGNLRQPYQHLDAEKHAKDTWRRDHVRGRSTTSRDRTALWIIAFFVATAWTVEAYWLIHASELPTRDDLLTRGFRFYGRGDRGYFDQTSPFEIGLESVHVFLTVPAYLWLAVAIVRRHVHRWPLQVCLGSYVSYSVLLYFAAKHMSGYVQTPVHDIASFLILYLPNLPWLFGSLYLAVDGGYEIMQAVALRDGRAA